MTLIMKPAYIALQNIKQRIEGYLNSKKRVVLKGYFKDWQLSSNYIKQHPQHWHLAYPKHATKWHEPKVYGPQRLDFSSQLIKHFPKMGILEIPSGGVVSKNGWIVDRTDTLLPDFSIFGNNIQKLSRSIKLPEEKLPIKHVSGKCLSIVSTWPGNYYHFLLDSIPRLHLYEKAGFQISDLEAVYCPPTKTSNAQRILQNTGISSDQVIVASDEIGVQADTLYAASFPGARRNCPRWVVQYLRNIANLPNASPSRRLYISRGKWSRKLLNETAAFAILERFGFEFYDPDEHPNQPLDFNQAEVIVAPHGAALANLVFCQPQTRFLELIPTDHPFAYFYTLAQSADLNYKYMVGDSIVTRQKPISASRQDFSIDLEIFERAVEDFFS